MAEWLFMGAVLVLPIYILADAGSSRALCQPEVKETKLISPAAGPRPKPGAQINDLVRQLAGCASIFSRRITDSSKCVLRFQ